MDPDRVERQEGNPTDSSLRSPYERDRDRVLYSDAFRRLAGVTQVVHVQEGHLFHNRLTHSLKVAQVGKRLAQYLIRDPNNPETSENGFHPEDPDIDYFQEAGGLNPEVVATAALAHDIGHPPFGHAIEPVLNSRVEDKFAEAGVDRGRPGPGSLDGGFESNAQSFRITTSTAGRTAENQGLDLTRATTNAILKYPWAKDQGPTPLEGDKWGYFWTEEEDYEWARKNSPAPDNSEYRRTLEAQVMDYADDVTYAVHDLTDFFRAGLVPVHEIVDRESERQEFLDYYLALDKEQREIRTREAAEADLDLVGSIFDKVTQGRLDRYDGTPKERETLRAFTSQLLTKLLGVRHDDDHYLHVKPDSGLHIPTQNQELLDIMKVMMEYYVFVKPRLAMAQVGQRRMIADLFDMYWRALNDELISDKVIPQTFRPAAKESRRISDDTDRVRRQTRLVCDIITDLTEPRAKKIHQQVQGNETATVTSQTRL